LGPTFPKELGTRAAFYGVSFLDFQVFRPFSTLFVFSLRAPLFPFVCLRSPPPKNRLFDLLKSSGVVVALLPHPIPLPLIELLVFSRGVPNFVGTEWSYPLLTTQRNLSSFSVTKSLGRFGFCVWSRQCVQNHFKQVSPLAYLAFPPTPVLKISVILPGPRPTPSFESSSSRENSSFQTKIPAERVPLPRQYPPFVISSPPAVYLTLFSLPRPIVVFLIFFQRCLHPTLPSLIDLHRFLNRLPYKWK